MNTKTHTDIKRLRWIESLPVPARPYAYLMRLDRPIGVWLLLFPSLWSIFLGFSDNVSYYHLISTILLFTFGAFVMRGAGCVVNDLWDRDLDRQVARTRLRPLASGALTPRRALVFLATLLLIGLLILVQFNILTITLGVLSLPLVLIYPVMKRITFWPQAFLGITFNFGALMGWSAITGTLEIPALLLYLGGIFWTLGYDTIYAHQDREDDALIGVKSTALIFEDQSWAWVRGFYGAAAACFVLACCAAYGPLGLLSLPPVAHLAWQLKAWDPDSPESALYIFKSNRDFALSFLGVCMILGLIF